MTPMQVFFWCWVAGTSVLAIGGVIWAAEPWNWFRVLKTERANGGWMVTVTRISFFVRSPVMMYRQQGGDRWYEYPSGREPTLKIRVKLQERLAEYRRQLEWSREFERPPGRPELSVVNTD